MENYIFNVRVDAQAALKDVILQWKSSIMEERIWMEEVYNIKMYNIISTFFCNNKKMLVIRMSGAACVMPEEDYHRIIMAERKYRRWKRRNAA